MRNIKQHFVFPILHRLMPAPTSRHLLLILVKQQNIHHGKVAYKFAEIFDVLPCKKLTTVPAQFNERFHFYNELASTDYTRLGFVGR